MVNPVRSQKRRWTAIAGVVLVCAAAIAYLALCPVCRVGIVMPPDAVAGKASAEPSKNLSIWNGSYHGPNYEDYSEICTRCWMAFHAKLQFWSRASEVPDAFRRALGANIRHVPLPPAKHVHYRVVYTQYVRDRRFGESVAFWCDGIPEVIQPLRAYSETHGLFFDVDDRPRDDGRQYVRIETNPPTI